MRSHVLTTLAIAGIGMGAPGVHAQSGRPSIRTSLDTAVIQVGDRLRLTIEVTHAETERVVWPDSLAIAPFEVLGARVGESVTSGDRITSSLELTLTAFELGNLVIPSFDVTIEGDSVRPLATDGWTVTVASVGLDEGGDVRDVKGPMTMPRNWWLLWPWVVGSLLVVALGWWLYRRHRLRERPATVAPFVPARSPHEVALEALETLEPKSGDQEQDQGEDRTQDQPRSQPDEDESNREQERQPQERPAQMSPEEAERLLQAIQEDPSKIERRRKATSARRRPSKEW